MRSIIAITMLTVLSGCTTYWVKPGATSYDFEIAKAECSSIAYRAYPPNNVIMPSYTPPATTTCTPGYAGIINCQTYGGVPSGGASIDMNVDQRNSFIVACLYNKGWQQQ